MNPAAPRPPAPLAALLLVIATVFVAQPAAAAPRLTCDIVAHRGASGVAPENTLAAVRLALKTRAPTSSRTTSCAPATTSS